VRFRPPPLCFGGTKTEKFSLHFLIFSRAIFSFKRKRKFFCFVFLLFREKRKRSNLNRKKAKIPSPQPPSFLPFCFSGFARFFSAGFEAVFCKAKCATKEDVALDPPNPFAGNAKELPKIFVKYIIKKLLNTTVNRFFD